MYFNKSMYKIHYTILIERGLIIVACQHICSCCSSKIGSSMILEKNHNVRSRMTIEFKYSEILVENNLSFFFFILVNLHIRTLNLSLKY
jgi:hypothetical protein